MAGPRPLHLAKEAATLRVAGKVHVGLDVDVKDLRVVIPSLGRPDTIGETLALFPPEVVTVCVSQEEAEAYQATCPGVTVLAHPGLRGLGRTRQWILDTMSESVIFMIDDDLPGCWAVAGNRIRRLRDPHQILGIVRQAARCAAEAGTPLFGFAFNADPRNFKAQSPFAMNGFVTGAMGFVGRDPRLQFDVAQRTKAEIDYSLQVLLYYRFLWKDTRYSFSASGEFQNSGGNSAFRTLDTVREDILRLKRRWGAMIDTTSERRNRGGRGKKKS